MPRSFNILASLDSSILSSTNMRYIQRTISISSGAPGTRMTRSVCMLFCSPRLSTPLCWPVTSRSIRRSPNPAEPPWRNPSSIRRHCPIKDLGGKLAAVLTGHGPLHALNDCRNGAAIILKLLGAIVHINLRASANVLVIGALVGILESSPTADIVDKNCTEIRLAILHIANQLFQRISTVNSKAAFAGIRVCPRDDHSSAFGILLDDFPLIIS